MTRITTSVSSAQSRSSEQSSSDDRGVSRAMKKIQNLTEIYKSHFSPRSALKWAVDDVKREITQKGRDGDTVTSIATLRLTQKPKRQWR